MAIGKRISISCKAFLVENRCELILYKQNHHIGYRNSGNMLYERTWKQSIIQKPKENKHFKKLAFSVKDFFSKFGQIRSFLRICSHLLKKSLDENFIFLYSETVQNCKTKFRRCTQVSWQIVGNSAEHKILTPGN